MDERKYKETAAVTVYAYHNILYIVAGTIYTERSEFYLTITVKITPCFKCYIHYILIILYITIYNIIAGAVYLLYVYIIIQYIKRRCECFVRCRRSHILRTCK